MAWRCGAQPWLPTVPPCSSAARVGGAADTWALPGGTPRRAESMAACARREVQEETELQPAFMPLTGLQSLDLRPPLAGHLRGMLGQSGRRYAPYLANLWWPEGSA
ncbi:MAG: NUDIX domain-containing protein [Streptosporangiaceae bacterium]